LVVVNCLSLGLSLTDRHLRRLTAPSPTGFISQGGPIIERRTGKSARPFNIPMITSAVITTKKYLKTKSN